MKVRHTARVIAAGVSLTVLAACGSSSHASSGSATTTGGSSGTSSSSVSGPGLTGSPIKIGTVGTFSGYSGRTSAPSADGLKAWASYTNAHGGINGHPVQVIVKDDTGVTTKSLANVKDLVENEHVVAIVGQNESGLEDTWANYVSGQKIPVIGGPSSGTSWLSNPDFYPAGDTELTTLKIAANGTVIAGKKSFGVVYCAEAPACANAAAYSKQITQQLGIGYAGAQAVSASSPSYTSQCLALKGDNAGAIFLAVDIGTAQRVVANCKAQNFSPTFIDNARNWSEDQLKNSVWQGTVFYSESALWFGNDPTIQTFLSAIKHYAPNTILNTSTVSGWAAGVTFGKAAAATITASATPTAAAVIQGMYTLGPNYDAGGLIPPVTYTQGQPATQKPCGWYMEVVNGQQTAPKGFAPVCLS